MCGISRARASALQEPLDMSALVSPRMVAARLQRTYDAVRLRRDLDALAGLRPLRQPGGYHKGEWVGHSLRAAGGRSSARPSMPGLRSYAYTPLLERTPYFRDILENLRCPQLAVRVLYLPPNGVIEEHVDDMFGFWHGVVRLHVPIVWHPDVVFLLGDKRQQWRPGELWYGDFALPHSMRNLSDTTRVHLVIDVLLNDIILGLFPSEIWQKFPKQSCSLHSPEVELSPSLLETFVCRFSVPGLLVQAFWPRLSTRLSERFDLERSSEFLAEARVWKGQLTVFLFGRPAVALTPIAPNTFTLTGWGPGVVLVFHKSVEKVEAIELSVRMSSRDEHGISQHRQKSFALPVAHR